MSMSRAVNGVLSISIWKCKYKALIWANKDCNSKWTWFLQDPVPACTFVGFCRTKTQMKKVTAVSKPVNIMPAMQILPSKQAKKVKGAVECELCEALMSQFGNTLTKNTTEVSRRSACERRKCDGKIHARWVMSGIAINWGWVVVSSLTTGLPSVCQSVCKFIHQSISLSVTIDFQAFLYYSFRYCDENW